MHQKVCIVPYYSRKAYPNLVHHKFELTPIVVSNLRI